MAAAPGGGEAAAEGGQGAAVSVAAAAAAAATGEATAAVVAADGLRLGQPMGRKRGRGSRDGADAAAMAAEVGAVAAGTQGAERSLATAARPSRRAKVAASAAISAAVKAEGSRGAAGSQGLGSNLAVTAASAPAPRSRRSAAVSRRGGGETAREAEAGPSRSGGGGETVKDACSDGDGEGIQNVGQAATEPVSYKARRRKATATVAVAAGSAVAADSATTAVEAAASPGDRRGKKAAVAVPRVGVLPPEEAAALLGQPLLDLGELVPGVLVRRPSATVKTPYVADVRLLQSPSALAVCDGSASAGSIAGGGGDGPLVLAHAPALDCAGMLVEDLRPGGHVTLVGSHPQLAERLAAEMIRRRCLEEALGPYDSVETQRTTLLEVKNVVCADFPEGEVPPGRPAAGVYTAPPAPDGSGYRPTALFPHGAPKPKIKVVSDRAIKHVGSPAGDASSPRAGLRAAVLFIVNRCDCEAFRPCHEADPLFAQVLKAAHEAGVILLAYDVVWSLNGQALPGKRLPVVFAPGVSAEYDNDRLAEVLHYNATEPRKKWKSTKTKSTQGGDAKGRADCSNKGRKSGAD
ncbi:hypothetical protein VOLCADRAFT_115580 [Volvox carteri f. nagariensis]|uniref:Sugar fermentation stimulation protein C-terminal domain-containing protein n=1 Tax=Volvox carteri f. nagariensis TaxID=3068 RepID=D8TGZ8_VOLCA|nr:uncharacterized protein VOLCADRAFT_115580 [Volvox carteri f. nagariensis]EFJ52624.1 hypothetical protein VOLCADRAFT_115580 [Volvox carteri f. nagariensis]|eukprot:XP_002945629.1 hypothetical protein VOLCADRAFT_115580 [Volvox carteri f. nagariensis]